MKRLVDKKKFEMSKFIIEKNGENAEDIHFKNVKLGQLEDIEQELGVDIANDLSKVLLASKNGFYSKEETINIHTKEKVCQIIFNNYAYCYCDGYGCWWVQTINKGYPPWNYGKTWALTREELENGIR